ncbi:MAG: epoxyqueuosine reductase [Thermoguttaceae bacterium]|jgi:epoxyqueuosine reductase
MTLDQSRAGASDEIGSSRFFSTLSPFWNELVDEAARLELDDVGVAPSGAARTYEIFAQRVREGYCDGLSYLTNRVEEHQSPDSVLPEALSIIVVALSERRVRDESQRATESLFNAPELQSLKDAPRGAVSGYATCLDYHDLLRKRLRALGRFLASRFPGAKTRAAVDTAPLLEKDWAVAAGLGFCGLHSLTIHPELGSRFFLGELLVSVPFQDLVGVASAEEYLKARNEWRLARGKRVFDAEKSAAKCQTCRRCVLACPTNAILGDRTLDSRRCLNYWTIENRDEIPDDIAQSLDGRLFGCDLCQRVCPHNANVESAETRDLPLDAVERLDEATFRRLFKKTPIFRARAEGLKRVAARLQDAANEGTEKREGDDRQGQ